MRREQKIMVSTTNFVVKSRDFYDLGSKSETLVYALIRSYWNANLTFFMTTRNMALTLKYDERTIQRALKRLEKKELIVCVRSPAKRIIRQPLLDEKSQLDDLFTRVYKKNRI